MFFSIANAQVVDESINGIQVGFLGIWLHNESKLAHNWSFRFEIGYESSLITDIPGNSEFPVFLPVVSLEPRWYYNSPKRQGNSNNTFHNSSDFATIAIRYYPKFLGVSPHEIKELDGGLFLIPTWGMRRNLSYRLNYELGIGVGADLYEFLFTEEVDNVDIILNFHLRIGYKFRRRAFQE